MTLRRRLLLSFLGLAVLPIALIGALMAFEAFRFVERQGRDELGGSLAALRARVAREVMVERASLESLVGDYNPDSTGAPSRLATWLAGRAEVLARMSDETAATRRILVLTPEADSCDVVEGHLFTLGTRVRTARVALASLPASYRRIAALAAAGWPPPPATLPGGTGPVLAVPVPLRATGPERALIIELSIVAMLDRAPRDPGARGLGSVFAAVRDEDTGRWRYIYASDPVLIGLEVTGHDWPARGGRLLADAIAAPPGGRAARGAPVFVRSGSDLYATGLDPGTGWLVGGARSLAPSLAPLGQSAQVALMLLGLMVVLVIAGIVWVTRGLGSVVDEIATSTGAIAGGDFDRVIRVSRSDEFGAIADHVNQMARELVVTAESRSIARLSARLTHDLKGVASQMNLLLHNLKLNYDDPEFRSEYPGLMQDLVGRVESLVLRLRRGGEEPAPQLERVDLDALACEIVAARGAARSSVVMRIETGGAGAVTTDPDLLRGVLENIVTNALEAMPDGGRLTVRTGVCPHPARAADRGELRRVEVEDTGAGMSPEFIQRDLFRPFATTKHKGIGLGLYQARLTVLRMGGRIEVTSREGIGTRVRIELPAAGAEPGAPATAAPVPAVASAPIATAPARAGDGEGG